MPLRGRPPGRRRRSGGPLRGREPRGFGRAGKSDRRVIGGSNRDPLNGGQSPRPDKRDSRRGETSDSSEGPDRGVLAPPRDAPLRVDGRGDSLEAAADRLAFRPGDARTNGLTRFSPSPFEIADRRTFPKAGPDPLSREGGCGGFERPPANDAPLRGGGRARTPYVSLRGRARAVHGRRPPAPKIVRSIGLVHGVRSWAVAGTIRFGGEIDLDHIGVPSRPPIRPPRIPRSGL